MLRDVTFFVTLPGFLNNIRPTASTLCSTRSLSVPQSLHCPPHGPYPSHSVYIVRHTVPIRPTVTVDSVRQCPHPSSSVCPHCPSPSHSVRIVLQRSFPSHSVCIFRVVHNSVPQCLSTLSTLYATISLFAHSICRQYAYCPQKCLCTTSMSVHIIYIVHNNVSLRPQCLSTLSTLSTITSLYDPNVCPHYLHCPQ